tara:strand:+ start:3790 stop:4371 length:582 start_codon:yes stop_codon:yes gene_type:complete
MKQSSIKQNKSNEIARLRLLFKQDEIRDRIEELEKVLFRGNDVAIEKYSSEEYKTLRELRREKDAIYKELDKKLAVVGMGCNRTTGSDTDPYEVVEVKSPTTIVIRACKAEGLHTAEDLDFQPGGFLGHFQNSAQRWEITSDLEAPLLTARYSKHGFWRVSYYSVDENGKKYRRGYSKHYLSPKPYKRYDYNF